MSEATTTMSIPEVYQTWNDIEHIVKGDFVNKGYDQLILIYKGQTIYGM